MEEEQNVLVEKQGIVLTEEPGEKVFCVKCGEEIQGDQVYCPKCGHKIGTKLESENSAAETSNASTSNNRIKYIIGAIAAVLVIIVTVFFIIGTQAKNITLNKDSVTVKVGEDTTLSFTIDPDNTKDKTVAWSSSNESIAMVSNGTISGINEGDCTITVKTKNGKTDTCSIVVTPAGPDLQALYNNYCSDSFASIASDGSYLSIDTNPNDIDEYFDTDAFLAITVIHEDLGLPESVLNRMSQTRSMDGIQSYSNDEVEITWTYHPNKGIEINYTLK